MKSECPTYLKSKGKAMIVTFSHGEVSDNELGCDEDGNFIVFTTTAIVNESISAEKNSSDGKLSEDADFQETYNKLCKVVAKDAMNVELGLKKIKSLKLDQMLSVQKSHSDKFRLGFVESISVFAPHSTNFVSSSSYEPSVSEVVGDTVKPPMSEVVKPIEVSPSWKIRIDLKEFKPKESPLSKDKMHGKPAWVCHFCG